MVEGPNNVTVLLAAVREGDAQAHDELLPQVYDELRRLAASHMRRERSNHTLQATALVNEAYIRLAGPDVAPNDRVHFFALAAQSMRRVLVDHARAKQRDKRGGGLLQVTLNDTAFADQRDETEVLELHEALQRLQVFDERAARALELLFFGGLTYDEVGEALGVSKSTVHADIQIARAWLAKEMGAAP